jgi:MFS family permease
VSRRITDRNIWLIDGAIFILGLAYGISLALVGIFLDERGYSKQDIGSLAAWFAMGIVALSIPAGSLIRRFSARAVLIVSLFGYAAAVAAFPFCPSYATIAAVRFWDGAFSVGIWVSCETILLSRADKENKAFITSLYAISLACGYIIGPLVARGVVARTNMGVGFMMSGGIATLAGLLVLLRLDPDKRHDEEADAAAAPAPPAGLAGDAAPPLPAAAGERVPASALLWRIKTSCFATFAYGYFQASVVLFLPLFLMEQKGITTEQTIVIPAFFAGGMLLFSNVAGRLGDRFGHLALMRVLAVIGTVMVGGFVYIHSYSVMCLAVFLAGATLASISPVSLALQGVVTPHRELSRANGFYNVFYAAGMLLGPPVSSRIYGAMGGGPMLYHLAALWTAFVVFSIVFFRDDPKARGVAPAPREEHALGAP